jgi:5-formyltetrahydrofolate cyclo-ligase
VAPFSLSRGETTNLSSVTFTDATSRAALRKTLRARRRAIQGKARIAAAARVAHQIAAAGWLRPGRRVGLYLAMPEELDTTPLLQLARQRRCTIALPRIVAKRQCRMRFFDLDGPIRRGAFGIQEPAGTRMRSARAMDIVFVPLVGFDAQGNRIGMGKGFYDRHFAHRGLLRHWRRPLLVGVAYDVQQVSALPVAGHDIPLDFIVTESTVLKICRSKHQ